MATITEDYVSFETAKLLKENGFDGKCSRVYIDGIFAKPSNGWEAANSDVSQNWCVCPSLQMAMKWLRKVYNWTICISPYWPEGDMRNKLTWYYDIHSLIDNRSFRESSYTDSYTKACEVAIKYCLVHLI